MTPHSQLIDRPRRRYKQDFDALEALELQQQRCCDCDNDVVYTRLFRCNRIYDANDGQSSSTATAESGKTDLNADDVESFCRNDPPGFNGS
jgi:hypothetical protein